VTSSSLERPRLPGRMRQPGERRPCGPGADEGLGKRGERGGPGVAVLVAW